LRPQIPFNSYQVFFIHIYCNYSASAKAAITCIICYVSGDTHTYINYLDVNDWILELDTFERRRGNTTTCDTTTWYILHLILYVGKDLPPCYVSGGTLR
jgi:hypothetical protein